MMIVQYSHTKHADDDGSDNDVIDDDSVITHWCWKVDDSEDVDIIDSWFSVYTLTLASRWFRRCWCYRWWFSVYTLMLASRWFRWRFSIHILMLQKKVQKMIQYSHTDVAKDDSEEDSVFTYWCYRRRFRRWFNIHILMSKNMIQYPLTDVTK